MISRLGRDTNKHVGKNKIGLYRWFVSTNFVDGCRMPVRNEPHRTTFELYAKAASHPLTALKASSKCSFIPYKLRFLVSFRLVRKHDPTFA
uniref:Uncharacterized protein n=1 Tax=Candidatus Kentrum sp. DK TaxID=2126562 RepID=A0A450T393_9GAMM|nr:MAG: hypothetical protein BECKDK2373B_GA0170837_10957 [Candidatus Kentron sp. DK]